MSRGKLARFLGGATLAVACVMTAYHLITTQYLLTGMYETQAIHLGFALTLVFLTALAKTRSRSLRPLIVALMLAGIVVAAYILLRMRYLVINTGFVAGWTEAVVGIVLVVLVLEATREAWGLVLPLTILVFIAYFFFGHLVPAPFTHMEFSPEFVLSMLGIGLHGVFGQILDVSANQIFLFIVFGGLLRPTGTFKFFIEAGKAIGKRVAGGPAQTAVAASCLVGMVMGTAVSNVALTGAFTIPLMKKTGYAPHEAGAVEAAASTGGQIMPPIMGAAAFIMAALLGMPYADIVVASFIPALLYFFAIGFGVRVMALKRNLPSPREAVDAAEMLRTGPLFIIPLALICVILFMRFSPNYAAFYGILAATALPFFRKSTRVPFSSIVHGIGEGATVGAAIAVSCAAIGILSQTMTTTNLGIIIAYAVEGFSGGNLWIALVLTMIVSLILGTGVPTPAAYLVVAITVAPVLVMMGVLPLAAHMFVFWFAVYSALTPPVAMASLTGAAIANAPYLKTCWQAIKLAAGGLILPYAMVYSPALLLRPAANEVVPFAFLNIVLVLLSYMVWAFNYFLVALHRWERVLFALDCVVLFSYFVTGSVAAFLGGASVFLLLTFWQWRRSRMPVEAPAMTAL